MKLHISRILNFAWYSYTHRQDIKSNSDNNCNRNVGSDGIQLQPQQI